MVTINQAGLAGKPPISIRVFDKDDAGHDLLGSCDIPLHKITSAEHSRIEDEIDATGEGIGALERARILLLDKV